MSFFHRRFERFIDPALDFDTTLKLFSIKVETGLAGFDSRRFFDAVYAGEGRIAVIPFMMLEEERVIFPAAARGLSPFVLERVSTDVKRFAASLGADAAPTLTVYNADPDLLWVAQMQEGAPLMLGLSTYAQIFSIYDRYDAALAYSKLGPVLDANAGLGDGARLIAHFCPRIDAVTEDPRVRSIGKRLGRHFLKERAENEDYALAVAFDCKPEDVDERAQRLRQSAPRALRLLSSFGREGRSALARLGTVLPISRAAFESSGQTDDWLVRENSKSSETATVTANGAASEPRMGSSDPLSILFVLRPSAGTAFGGDVVQVQRTAQALQQRGHRVVITTDEAPNTDGFDIVHLSNLTAALETLRQAHAVRNFPGPVVLMPIFIDHADEAIWGMDAHVAAFTAGLDEGQLEGYLRALEDRSISANARPRPPFRAEPFEQYAACQHDIIQQSDLLVANALSEVHRIYRHLDCTIPFSLAPSCVDGATYGFHAREAFVSKYGLADFVLCTGRFEERKNQLMLMHALRDLPYTLVLIGSHAAGSYGGLVRAYQPRNTIVISQMPEQELAGAYAAARVLALPSWDECVSLSSLNGAISQASLVLTRNGYEHEYFRDDAIYCDPASVDGIRAAVVQAWEQHERLKERRHALASRVRLEYSWERAAELTETAYRQILESNPRGAQRRALRVAQA